MGLISCYVFNNTCIHTMFDYFCVCTSSDVFLICIIIWIYSSPTWVGNNSGCKLQKNCLYNEDLCFLYVALLKEIPAHYKLGMC